MASQPVDRIDTLERHPVRRVSPGPGHTDLEGAEDRWRAYHLFYHQDQDRLLLELVRPLVTELLTGHAIDRFYFVRYNLGGPHVRLRWRVTGDPTTAERVLAGAAAQFFGRSPSTESLPDETVRKLNRSVLGVDPLASPDEDVVYPDNSWRGFPPRFEVERYGGPARFASSLELFTASSLRALELVDAQRGLTKGQGQARFVRLLIQMAATCAASEGSLFELTGYGVRFMGRAFQPCVDQGDRAFEERPSQLTVLAESALAPEALRGEPLAEAMRRFAPSVDGLEPKRRWSILASHLHMTANRLGLGNADEVYLSRLAERATRQAAQRRPEGVRAAARTAPASPGELGNWVSTRLATLHRT